MDSAWTPWAAWHISQGFDLVATGSVDRPRGRKNQTTRHSNPKFGRRLRQGLETTPPSRTSHHVRSCRKRRIPLGLPPRRSPAPLRPRAGRTAAAAPSHRSPAPRTPRSGITLTRRAFSARCFWRRPLLTYPHGTALGVVHTQQPRGAVDGLGAREGARADIGGLGRLHAHHGARGKSERGRARSVGKRL